MSRGRFAFQAGRFPYGPTMEGQYIIKNLMIISAALVVGGTVREGDESLNTDCEKAKVTS